MVRIKKKGFYINMTTFAIGLIVYSVMCAYAITLFSSGFLLKHSNSTEAIIPPFDHQKLSYIAVAKKSNRKTGNYLQFLAAIFFFDGCICLTTSTATGRPFTVLSTFFLFGGILGFIWTVITSYKKYIVVA